MQEEKIFKKAIAERMGYDDFEEMIDNLISRAKTFDKSFEVLRDTMGQKPKDELDALNMLTKLQGNTHEVITGVAVAYNEEIDVRYCVSKVVFKKATKEELVEYIKTKEPMDKAGSYAIQGIGSKFIDYYEGEFDNIVGLPMKLVFEMLENK